MWTAPVARPTAASASLMTITAKALGRAALLGRDGKHLLPRRLAAVVGEAVPRGGGDHGHGLARRQAGPRVGADAMLVEDLDDHGHGAVGDRDCARVPGRMDRAATLDAEPDHGFMRCQGTDQRGGSPQGTMISIIRGAARPWRSTPPQCGGLARAPHMVCAAVMTSIMTPVLGKSRECAIIDLSCLVTGHSMESARHVARDGCGRSR